MKYHDNGGRKGYANLPTKEMIKPLPKSAYGAPQHYEDTMMDLDKQAAYNHKQISKKPAH